MPTFTAITLDGLLEPGSRSSMPKPPLVPVRVEKPSSPIASNKKIFTRPHPQASPVLYATPESTPLPDSPSSFPPSPYIINHKRRGPRLRNSLSMGSVENGSGSKLMPEVEPKVELVNGSKGQEVENGSSQEKAEVEGLGDGLNGTDDTKEAVVADVEKDAECDDFFDPQDSMSAASNTEIDESNGLDRSWKPSTPLGEYFDAFEEISSEGAPLSAKTFEDDLREMRLNLLMELERRHQAEEALENLRNQWDNLSQELSTVGFMLPPPLTSTEEMEDKSDLDPAADLCQQIIVARAVAASIARGCSRAEFELEIEPQIESKNFEIARLWDRLHYYEATNREMSQRNQEAVEMARQQRHRRKRRQKWILSSIGLAITLGAAAVAWSYLPASKAPSHDGDIVASNEK